MTIDSLLYGGMVSFVCAEGYVKNVGQFNVSCTATGNWTGSGPTCESALSIDLLSIGLLRQ